MCMHMWEKMKHSLDLRNGKTLAGSLPKKKLNQVVDWLKEPNNRASAEQLFYELNPRLRPKQE